MTNLMRRIIAMGAATVMAASTLSVGASAVNWGVRYTPMAPSSENVSLDEHKFLGPKSTLTYVKESCTSYFSAQTSNGVVAFVKYWGYSADTYGRNVTRGFINYYHYRTQATHTINLVNPTQEDFILHVKHQLQNGSIHSAMNGTIAAY